MNQSFSFQTMRGSTVSFTKLDDGSASMMVRTPRDGWVEIDLTVDELETMASGLGES